MGMVMEFKSTFTSRRHVFSRVLVSSALVGTSFIVGLATTASADPALHLSITTQPSATTASGAVLAQQPVVQILNGSDVVQSSDSTTVVATVTSGGTNTVSSGSIAAAGGVATFNGLALNATAGPQTITFSDGTDQSTVSATVTVSIGAASHLVFSTAPPAGVINGVALTPQPVVNVVDSGRNVVTSNTSTITVTSTTIGTSFTNNTKAAVNGVATFAGFLVNANNDTNVTLSFSNGVLPAIVTGPIGVTGPGTQLSLSTAPSLAVLSGAALAIQPVISIKDSGGFVLQGDTSTVTAALVAGSAGSSVTNGTRAAVNGVATFSGLALNALAGGYKVTFTDGALTSVTTGANTVISTGSAAKLAISTQPSSATPTGKPLAQQPVVFIQDSGGNLASANTSTVTATLTTGNGTVANANAVALGGVATFSGLTINAAIGLYTLTFSDGALTAATSTAITLTAGAAAKLVISVQPSSTTASGAVLAQQPVVKVADSGGNVILGNSSTVTATLTSGTGTLVANTAAVSASTGLATFSGLTLKTLTASYTLTFSDGALTPGISTLVTVTPGVASRLVISAAPSITTASGAVLAAQPVVKVEDASGNVVTSDTSTVTAKITTGGVSVTPPTRAAVAGVATFSGVALNALVGTYTLTFSDGALTAVVSTTIAVTIGAASRLVVSTEPSPLTGTGAALAKQPVIKVEDTGGNVVPTVSTGAVTAAIYSGAGGAVSAGAAANFNAGVATFSGLTLTGVAGTSYTLNYTGAGLSVIDASAIKIGYPQAVLVVTRVSAIYGRSFALHTGGGSGTGAISFTVTNGGNTATGCNITGAVLKSSTPGTCVVTATKASDATFTSTSSVATTVTFSKLAIPRAVRINFAANSSTLSLAAKNQINALARRLTTHSVVLIAGHAKGNLGLSHRRAAIVAQYLIQRVRVKVHFHWDRSAASSSALITTLSQ